MQDGSLASAHQKYYGRPYGGRVPLWTVALEVDGLPTTALRS